MFGSVFNDKRVLVTGNTGFKGSWLSIWLRHLGAEVHGLANGVLTEPSMFEGLKLADNITHHHVDVTDLERLRSAVDEIKPDIVFHLAAQAIVFEAYRDPVSTHATNAMGTANLLGALRDLERPCHAIMITSDKCYENVEWMWGYRENDRLGGKDPYSASKACAELIIRSFHESFFAKDDSLVQIVSARAGNVIGGGDWSANRIVPDCIRAWTRNEAVEIRRPQATRPWQHVLEPLSGYLRLAQCLVETTALKGESFNFGPSADQNHTVLELLKKLCGHWFSDDPGYDPIEVGSDDSHPEAGLLKLSCDKASSLLKWQPTLGFERTAHFTADWYQRFYSDGGKGMEAFTSEQIDEYCSIASAASNGWALQ